MYNGQHLQDKRILVYCGINNGDGLVGMYNNYDVIYGFDANPEKVRICQQKFPSTMRRQFKFYNYALTDKDDETIKFNIFKNWDPSSTIGTLNPEYAHCKNEDGILHNTKIDIIEVKTINLGNFLRKIGIQKIDKLLTDLQGYDLTVLRTLEDFIEKRSIGEIKCEVEWDTTPPIHLDIPSNKLSDFIGFFNGRYEQTWYQPGSESWWETDIIFRPKQ